MNLMLEHPFFKKLKNSELYNGIKWSFIGHIVILVLVIIQNLFFPSHVSVYVPTLRVDLVGLPDILKKDLNKVKLTSPATKPEIKKEKEPAKVESKPEKTPETKPETIRDEGFRLPEKNKLTKRNHSALERIKALEKIQESIPSPTVIKGNKISPGSSLSADAKEGATDQYYDLIQSVLKRNFLLPPWLKRQKELNAQVQVRINAQGQLRGFEFVKTSGNPKFDEEVKRALQVAQPYPAPPASIQDEILEEGLLVGFPL